MRSPLNNGQFDPMADNQANYKLGIFYFNRKDKRTFVPKRYRLLGWTINFGRPYVYLGTIIIVAIIIFEMVME